MWALFRFYEKLLRDYVYSLCAFRILRNLKLYGLTFSQGLKPFTLNSGIVDKYIFARFLLNEAEAL